MMNNTSIFGLRFKTNEKLQPSLEELQLFLASKKTGTQELQSDDLLPYRELLAGLAGFKTGSAGASMSDKMVYTVLGHSHFVHSSLKLAIEQFKFHVHALSALDFKKPAAFIKSAEDEISRLNTKKKEEALRIERMRGMVEDRKQILATQNRLWGDLTQELSHIIDYITDNLVGIEKLCETSIKCLVSEQIDRKKEVSLIEDIKMHFKERLRESLHQGTISKEQLEIAKAEVADLSKRTANLLRSDVYTMTQLYELIHGHAGKIVRELGAVNEEIRRKKHANYDDDLALYSHAGKILVALVSACRFEVKAVDISTETTNDKLLAGKRKEIFDHLVELLPKTP